MGIFGAIPLVLRGSHTSEFLEFMNEVGLVVVAAIESELAPVDIAMSVRCSNDLLKAADAAEEFRRQADLVVK